MEPPAAVTEFTHRGQSRLQIQQVVGAQLLALQLDSTTPAGCLSAVPASLLMRIFAVAQLLTQGERLQPGQSRGRCLWLQIQFWSGLHPAGDGCVVGRCMCKCLKRQLPADRGIESAARCLERCQDPVVLIRIGEHRHMLVVLGR